MRHLRHIYTKTVFVAYLKFKFNGVILYLHLLYLATLAAYELGDKLLKEAD